MLHLDADIRLARRIRRDTVERGRDVNSVLEQVEVLYKVDFHVVDLGFFFFFTLLAFTF